MLLVLVFECIILSRCLGRALRLVHAKGTLAWSRGILLEIAIGKLAVLLAPTPVVRWVHSLDLDHDWAKVILRREDVVVGRDELWLHFLHVDDEDLARELLIQPGAEAEGARRRHLRITVKIQGDVRSVAALDRAQVHGDHALVVRVELHFERVLVRLVW